MNGGFVATGCVEADREHPRHPPNLEAYYVNVDSPFSVRGRGR
jgi:hypothetical protein